LARFGLRCSDLIISGWFCARDTVTVIQAVREGHERLERPCAPHAEHWRMRPLVAALTSLRGIDFVAAATLAAAIGDFSRFAHPTELMGFFGPGTFGALHG
jgi:transposase